MGPGEYKNTLEKIIINNNEQNNKTKIKLVALLALSMIMIYMSSYVLTLSMSIIILTGIILYDGWLFFQFKTKFNINQKIMQILRELEQD